jgi:hypothetical protein
MLSIFSNKSGHVESHQGPIILSAPVLTPSHASSSPVFFPTCIRLAACLGATGPAEHPT